MQPRRAHRFIPWAMAEVGGSRKNGLSDIFSIGLLSFRWSFEVNLGQIDCHRWQFPIELLEHFEAFQISSLERFHESSFLRTGIRKKFDQFCCAQFEQQI